LVVWVFVLEVDIQRPTLELTLEFGKRFDHIGICSSRLNAQGEPYIVHNIGSGEKEENVLRAYKMVEHFRIFDRTVSSK